MTAATFGPEFLAFLNNANTGDCPDLQEAVNDYVRTAIELQLDHELRDAILNRWFDDHAGNSLVASVHNGVITSVQEMSTTDADMLTVFDPDGTLIVATWVGETR